MSDLKKKFDAAAADSKNLSEVFGNDVKLKLYGLFKQGSTGDVTGSRPGFTDLVGGAKYDAWAAVKGISTEDAMQQYIGLVESLKLERTAKANDPVKLAKEVIPPLDDRERERRRALVRAHYAAENDHDLERIMATFSADAVMLYNRQSFPSGEAIRLAHGYMGMSAAPGALGGLRAIVDQEHFTDAETVIEGRVCGRHNGEFLGFPPTQRHVELPFVAFYRFDANGKLTSERVVMNLGPLRG
jgi:diazepam-binding inhibitor (GABA receptor modulator, acyl-CoA-binding protein)